MAWGKCNSIWRDVPKAEWADWRWQMRNLVRTPAAFRELLQLPEAETAAITALQSRSRIAITPYYFSLIDTADPLDPIRRMMVPSAAELAPSGLIDPLGEVADRAAPGIIHRYPDRVLFIVTEFCSSYCRFCVRKRNWTASDAARTRADVDAAIAYIRSNTQIRDVLVSGGDPLTLPLDQLDYILRELRSIPHIEIVRIGSREPVMLPMRITDDLLRILDRGRPVWLNTHFNHPREITEEAAAACDRLSRAGVPLGNQSVLLAGVNDDLATMRDLVHGLLRIRVRPYYLYHADPVEGAAHLRTSIAKGIELIEGLRGHTTGFAVPTYVVDAPGGGGKIPVSPEYVVRAGPGELVLRNYAGEQFVLADG